jgi:Na+-translocating ferredoxin:NAD+ oxidoreductase RnfG subunit
MFKSVFGKYLSAFIAIILVFFSLLLVIVMGVINQYATSLKEQSVVQTANALREYIKEEMRFQPSMDKLFTVPEGKVFVMGDNRNNSADSREEHIIGMIDERYIVGKVIYRIGDTHIFNSDFKES